MKGDALASGSKSATFIVSEGVSQEKWNKIWEEPAEEPKREPKGRRRHNRKVRRELDFPGR